MRYVFLLLLYTACTPSWQDAPDASHLKAILSSGKWLDLSHGFSDSTLYWPNNKSGFHLDTMFDRMTEGGYYYAS